MATVPQRQVPQDQEEDFDVTFEGANLPGHTVDALLRQGKVEEAREELERLLQEGVDSGPGIEVTPAFWAELKAEVRQKSALKR